MTAITRRNAVLSMGAALAFPSVLTHTRAYGAEFTMKFANNAAPTHPLTVRIKEATDAIRAETGGKVDIQVFPNGQLGGDTDMLSQLRAGGIEFFTLSPLILSTLVPKASLTGIGYAWSGYDKLWPALDGELGSFVRAEIAKSGLHAFPRIFDNGFRQISSSTRPIKTPEDLKNFKIRVPPSPLWTSMFKGLDAAPLTINFSELYSALQTKVVDGQENPLVTVDTSKLYEVQKFLSKTNHMWDGFWPLANGRMWAKLPQEVKQVIEKNITAGVMKQRADILRLNTSLEADLTTKGLIFNSIDSAAFQRKLQESGFYKEWAAKYGAEAWKLLEKSTGVTL